ncbi:MAG: hypothetical protein AB7S81_07995 [Bdellovibrionales bacterium]
MTAPHIKKNIAAKTAKAAELFGLFGQSDVVAMVMIEQDPFKPFNLKASMDQNYPQPK